ncbi:MAG: hypothetical protein M5T61_20930 [Acidimicrobiia bacterium]|nr:hypothetical protein [Acidimicrobiia bacterium]
MVAALDDLGGCRDDQPNLVGRTVAAALLVDRDEALGDGAAHQVELRRRLRDRSEDRVLGEAQLGEVGVEVADRGGLHTVALVPVEVLVEVGLHDLLLALLAREGPGVSRIDWIIS